MISYCVKYHILNRTIIIVLTNDNIYLLTGITYDQEEVYAVDENQEELIPPPGSWIAMEVSTILTPSRFFVILPMGNKSLDNIGGRSSKSQSSSMYTYSYIFSVFFFRKNAVSSRYDQVSYSELRCLRNGNGICKINGNQLNG